MKKDTKSATFLSCGYLLVMFGSMPLNGYIGFLLSPSEFHQDNFIGTLPHLLVGLIPWVTGLVLIVYSEVKPWFFPAIMFLAGIAGGFLICLSATINAKTNNYKALFCWIAIASCAVIIATTIRAITYLCYKSDAGKAAQRA